MRKISEINIDKDRLFKRYDDGMTLLYTKQCKEIIAWFKNKYPNHTLEWTSGMGAFSWIYNGYFLDLNDWEKYLDERFTSKIIPLIEFYDSINDCPSYTNICIGNVK